VKFSTSLVLVAIAAAILVLSLGLKVLTSPFGRGGAAPVPRDEELRRFLAAATVGPVEAFEGGWRFPGVGGCRLLAYPSGPRGTLDMAATSHAHGHDRIAYVYRGQVMATPPAFALALDVIAYTLSRPFRTANEPGYVVLIAPQTCPGLPNLPWGRLPTT
jgi:hypothetical protein